MHAFFQPCCQSLPGRVPPESHPILPDGKQRAPPRTPGAPPSGRWCAQHLLVEARQAHERLQPHGYVWPRPRRTAHPSRGCPAVCAPAESACEARCRSVTVVGCHHPLPPATSRPVLPFFHLALALSALTHSAVSYPPRSPPVPPCPPCLLVMSATRPVRTGGLPPPPPAPPTPVAPPPSRAATLRWLNRRLATTPRPGGGPPLPPVPSVEACRDGVAVAAVVHVLSPAHLPAAAVTVPAATAAARAANWAAVAAALRGLGVERRLEVDRLVGGSYADLLRTLQ